MDFNVTFDERENDKKVGFQEVIILKGEDGATYTPILSNPKSDTLRIEWENNKGLENPEPIEIIAPKGNPFTYKDFTPEQLNGLKPIKGEDYFTEEEVDAIIGRADKFAQEAEKSATAAEQSASDAADYALDSEQSEKNAAASEKAANDSAKAAKTSESNAATSATAANKSETAAAASAKSAADSASVAEKSKSDAQTLVDNFGNTVEEATTGAVNTVNETKDNAVNTVNALLDTIPEDYTAMAADVDELKSDLINVNNIKADKTALASTNRRVDAIYKITDGQSWQEETVDAESYSNDIPSGSVLAKLKKIGGKSVVWNQLNDMPTFTNKTLDTRSHIEFRIRSYNNGTYNLYVAESVRTTGKKSYLWTAGENATQIQYCHNGLLNMIYFAILDVDIIKDHKYYSAITFESIDVTTTDGCTAKNIMLIDLTTMFGSGNEPTAEEFKAMFTNDYYPYCEPTIISSQTDRVDVRGRNLLPVQTSFNNRISLFFPSGTKLFASCKDDGIGAERVAYFRQDKTQIDYWGLTDLGNGRKGRAFTAEEDIYYIAIFSNNGSQYIMTDQQLEYGTTATEYSPYSLQQIETGFPVLNELDSIKINEGKLYQGVGVDRLADFSWRINKTDDTRTVFYTNSLIGTVKPVANNNVIPNVVTVKYNPACYNATFVPNDIGLNSDGYLYITLDANKTVSDLISVLSDDVIYYELAEPIITDIEIPAELADYIVVEAGGSITFHNADEGKRLLIPNTTTYAEKLSEVTNG